VLVFVAVVQIREMRVLMQDPFVAVQVAMGLAGRITRRMPVLVVGVMHVPMLMLERLMQVLVFVRLCEVQIDANAHEQPRR
jgi:hypothetical protein